MEAKKKGEKTFFSSEKARLSVVKLSVYFFGIISVKVIEMLFSIKSFKMSVQTRLYTLISVYCFVGFTAYAQPKLLEKITKTSPDEVVIPYEKYVLPNGLIVLVHEDHSDPLVHVDVTYHVGSAREEIGKSGFAHFFEHMMFQGSDNVADEQHFKIITEAGGTLNGSTNRAFGA